MYYFTKKSVLCLNKIGVNKCTRTECTHPKNKSGTNNLATPHPSVQFSLLKRFLADLMRGGGCPETTQLSHFNATNSI